MIRKIRLIPNLLRGRYTYVPELVASHDGLSESEIRSELEEVVQSGYLEQLSENYYVVPPLADDEEREATQEIVQLGNQLFNMSDTRTKVEISGSMVKDRSFKTEKDPSELVK